MNQQEYLSKFKQKKSPLQAIKMKCWDCCGGSSDEARLCTCEDTCVLYPFRMGKNPFKEKRVMSDEEKNALRKRLQNARLVKIHTEK